MSNIRDRGVIDITLEEDGKYVLIIADDMEWGFDKRQNHVRILQDKINDYLAYIGSGQAAQAKPGLRPVIRLWRSMHTASMRSIISSGKGICKEEG